MNGLCTYVADIVCINSWQNYLSAQCDIAQKPKGNSEKQEMHLLSCSSGTLSWTIDTKEIAL